MAERRGIEITKNLTRVAGELDVEIASESASGVLRLVVGGTPVLTASAGGIGVPTGAGGSVTQATSISTGVALNTIAGKITTVSSTLAAAAEATFTVTNSKVAATDVVVVSTTYGGAGTPLVFCSQVAAGTFNITITNLHAANALDNVLVINFIVLKGASA